jgi:hypothetical protein
MILQHSLVQVAKFVFSNSYFTNTAFLGTDCKMFFFPNSYFTNTAFLGTDCKMGFLFEKKLFYNLYQGMLYWWNKCLKKKTFYNLYQGMLYWWNKWLFHQYNILWYRLHFFFFPNSYFTNTTFFGTDCKIFFFQTVISPIQHSLVQIVKCFFSNSYPGVPAGILRMFSILLISSILFSILYN